MSDHYSNRTDISAGHGHTNSITGQAYYNLAADTARDIYQLLADHCGPYASDALVIHDNTGANLKDRHHAIFTKDGIGIVRALEFTSPIQRHVQELIAYVGDRVEKLSHDGTTTSMMLFAGLVCALYSKYADQLQLHTGHSLVTSQSGFPRRCIGDDISIDPKQMREDITVTLTAVAEAFEQMVISVERLIELTATTATPFTELDAIRFITYHQAMISSKGDSELASALVEVVEAIPKELYGLFSIAQTGQETDQRFTVVEDDYTFNIPTLINLDDCNHRLGTEYLAESCDLIVSDDKLIKGNPALELLEQHAQAAHDGQRSCDLVIIAPAFDPMLLKMLSTINQKSKAKLIALTVAQASNYSSKATVLEAVAAVGGVYSMLDHLSDPSLPYIIHNAKVQHRMNRVYLDNLYVKDGSRYHPSFTNPDRFPPYTKVVTTIGEQLHAYVSGRLRFESAADQARYQDFNEIYKRMVSARVKTIKLSGMTHDALADRDILTDAYGAVLSSLEYGFVLDGFLKIGMILNQVCQTNVGFCNEMRTTVQNILAAVHRHPNSDRVKQELENLHDRHTDEFIPTIFWPVWKHDNPKSDRAIVCSSLPRVTQENGNWCGPLWDVTLAGAEPIGVDVAVVSVPALVMQPADTYREMFRRLQDLLPKLANTNRAVIPGTVNRSVTL